MVNTALRQPLRERRMSGKHSPVRITEPGICVGDKPFTRIS
jgi:hypothetical protein